MGASIKMNDRNNLGRQYTSDPNFGTTYPNTQYKGYQDHESAPYGASSGEHRVPPVNQYGYTRQYQGHNPYHQEGRFSNVQAHGSGQYMGQSQYTGTKGVSQYQGGRSGYITPYTPEMHYGYRYAPSPNPGMMGESGYAGSQATDMRESGYPVSQATGMRESAYPVSPATGMGASSNPPQSFAFPGAGFGQSQNQETAGLYSAMIDPAGMGSSFRNETQSGIAGAATTTTGESTTSLTEMQDQTGVQLNDRDRLQDLLSSEKYLTEGYNVSTFEASDPELHKTLQNILNETHQSHEILHQTMEQRGWYKTDSADQQAVAQAYNQFMQNRYQLPF